jgi:hypothetical protein
MLKLDLKQKMAMNINEVLLVGGPVGGEGGQERARRREYDQSTLYACMKIE